MQEQLHEETGTGSRFGPLQKENQANCRRPSSWFVLLLLRQLVRSWGLQRVDWSQDGRKSK